jgi:hypothetical protein
LPEIAEGLNVDEAVTPRGRRWYASGTRFVLGNRAYVPDVIDEETFGAAQRRLAQLRPGMPK